MTTWAELPEQVRNAVQSHVGPVSTTTAVTDGQNSDIATVLHRPDAPPVFLLSQDVAGWLVVGFDHVTGRSASLAPDSPDLPIVASTVNRISTLRGTGLRPLRERFGVTDWWYKLAAEAPTTVYGWDLDQATRWASAFPELADGDRLAHTDLHADQFLLSPGGTTHVIDWGYPGTGAGWVDGAFLTLRLIEAGHHPVDAETWTRTHLTRIAEADPQCLTAFAVYIAGLWGYWAATADISASPGRARLARDYASWRLTTASIY